jgi:hypothetical protein
MSAIERYRRTRSSGGRPVDSKAGRDGGGEGNTDQGSNLDAND